MIQNISTKLCGGIPAEILLTRNHQSIYMAMNVINGTCSFVAVVGNVVMILAILRNSSLRHNPSFMLIFNLAVSDVGVGLICQPLIIVSQVVEARKGSELSCSKLTIAYKSTVGCLAVVSILTITSISFDRFLAVSLKLNYRSVVTVKRMKVVILLLWLVTLLSGMTYALDSTIFYALATTAIFLCLIFTTFNYLAISSKLYGHSTQLNERNRKGDSSNQHRLFNLGQYEKTLKSMLYVYGAFLMCYLPYLCFVIALKSISRTSAVRAAYYPAVTSVMANSAINPCLCYWRIAELQQAVQRLLGLNCLVRRKATRFPTATSESTV